MTYAFGTLKVGYLMWLQQHRTLKPESLLANARSSFNVLVGAMLRLSPRRLLLNDGVLRCLQIPLFVYHE